MAVRSNIGNVVTNANQVLSVGATTASRLFRDRADSSLVNWTDEEKTEYAQYQKDKKMAEMKAFREKPELEKQRQEELEKQKKGDPKTYSKEWFESNPDKAKEVGVAEAEKRYKRAVGDNVEDEEENIDDILSVKSPQAENIKQSVFNNISWLKNRELKTTEEEAEELRALGVL